MQSKEKQTFKQRYNDKWLLNIDQVKVSGTDENGEATEHYEGVAIFVSKISREDIVPKLIRHKYSIDDEAKMLRLAISDPTDADFVAYNAYVEDCRLVGKIITGALALDAMTVAELDRTAAVYGVEDYPASGLKAEKYDAIWLHLNPPAPEPEPEVEEEGEGDIDPEADPESEPETEPEAETDPETEPETPAE